MSRPRRLVLVGSVLVDVVMFVPHLPERGGDVLADASLVASGGGFNVVSAAARQGLPALYAGRHGAGRFGDQVRADLAREGVDIALPVDPSGDTGLCVVLVDGAGERTFATHSGVDGELTPADLTAVTIGSDDLVHLSGYELAYAHGQVMGDWFAALDPAVATILDPGPLVGGVDPALRDAALRRADWVSANAVEAAVLTGGAAPREAAIALRARGFGRCGVVVRDGAAGCVTQVGDDAPRTVPVPVAPPGPVIDTSGAGDTHVGAFVAALGRGLDPVAACRWANAAAARCVTVRGAASCPTLAVTRADLLTAAGEPRASSER